MEKKTATKNCRIYCISFFKIGKRANVIVSDLWELKVLINTLKA
jgi:hypothetical protein